MTHCSQKSLTLIRKDITNQAAAITASAKYYARSGEIHQAFKDNSGAR
jgi:hypothetical protein